MTTATFLTVKSVASHKVTNLNEVCKTERLLKLNIKIVSLTRDEYITPELLLKFLNLFDSLLKTSFVTTHTYEVPHDVTELLV